MNNGVFMTDQAQQPTQITEKVTNILLDRMYGNFVKITDWVMKGKESKYPMPKALAGLFNAVEFHTTELAELKQLVTTLQQNLIEKEQRIAQLDNALQGVNSALRQLVDEGNAQHQQTPAPQNEGVPEPVAPSTTPAPVVDELVDLDDVAGDVVPHEQESSNEQVIQASAEAVGAGQLDPASYAALDAEIGALLSK